MENVKRCFVFLFIRDKKQNCYVGKILRKILILAMCMFYSMQLYSQDMFDKSLRELEKVNGLLVDASASFFEYPYDHANTLVVFKRLQLLNEAYKELQKNKYEVLSHWDNYKVRQFYDKVDKMQAITAALEELIRPIAGYNSSGIEGPNFEILLVPIFDAAGWKKRMLPIKCEHAYFIEYTFGNFKMMFVKSILSANDYRNHVYNNIEVTYEFAGQFAGGGSIYVGGNKYRMVQFKDNMNTSYKNLAKAKSERR